MHHAKEKSDERIQFRVISLIMEAKRPNDTAFETLLTREAMYEMLEFEKFLYNITLREDALTNPDPSSAGMFAFLAPPVNKTENSTAKLIGLADLC